MGLAESVCAFGGVPCALAEARAVVIPVPYDLTTSYRTGARDGPRALIEASTHMELFDQELGFSPIDIGVHTAEPLEQAAAGPGAMVRRIAEEIGQTLREKRIPIVVGGDHSVSIGAFMALEDLAPDVTILQFDAHADLREEFQGTPYSHACVMARARERFPAVQIGVRSLSEPEFRRIQAERLPVFPVARFREDREELVREALGFLGARLYITIDLDCLDPSILPATGTPEPGGLLWDEILWLVRTLVHDREVVGFDLVELSPIPGFHAPDFLAAKLLYKVLGYTCPPRRFS